MKELDLSCLICALDLKVAQKFPEDARTAKGCSKRQSCSEVTRHNRDRPGEVTNHHFSHFNDERLCGEVFIFCLFFYSYKMA